MTVTAPAPQKDTYSPLELFDIDRLLDSDERDIAAEGSVGINSATEGNRIAGIDVEGLSGSYAAGEVDLPAKGDRGAGCKDLEGIVACDRTADR